MARLRVTVAMLAVTLALGVSPVSRAAQIPSSDSDASEAKACKLMPTPDLEASYGGKVTNPHGVDGDSSVCTVNIAGLAVKLESAAAGHARSADHDWAGAHGGSADVR